MKFSIASHGPEWRLCFSGQFVAALHFPRFRQHATGACSDAMMNKISKAVIVSETQNGASRKQHRVLVKCFVITVCWMLTFWKKMFVTSRTLLTLSKF